MKVLDSRIHRISIEFTKTVHRTNSASKALLSLIS